MSRIRQSLGKQKSDPTKKFASQSGTIFSHLPGPFLKLGLRERPDCYTVSGGATSLSPLALAHFEIQDHVHLPK